MRGTADPPGGIHRTKHLYLYRGEPWRRGGDTAVRANPPPSDVDMRWLSAAEWERSPSLLPIPENVASERFADGARCLVIQRRDGGDLVYHLWLSTAGAWIDWIAARVVPPDGYVLVFDVWAHPDWRRGRLHIPAAAEVARALGDLGLRGMAAGVEEHEVVPFARMYARAGLGFIVPYEILVWHRLGPLSWHRRTQPAAHLVESCADIRRRYEEP
jgi:hypothetical protein